MRLKVDTFKYVGSIRQSRAVKKGVKGKCMWKGLPCLKHGSETCCDVWFDVGGSGKKKGGRGEEILI